MTDAWDEAGLPTARGPGKSKPPRTDENSPLAIVSQLVDDLNGPDLPHESRFAAGLAELIHERGLFIVEELSVDRRDSEDTWTFDGFLLMLAPAKGLNPFAAIRMRDGTDGGRWSRAELWRLDQR